MEKAQKKNKKGESYKCQPRPDGAGLLAFERYSSRHLSNGRAPDEMVSSSITTKDHFLDLTQQMTYPDALAKAQQVARLRKSERIIVEP